MKIPTIGLLAISAFAFPACNTQKVSTPMADRDAAPKAPNGLVMETENPSPHFMEVMSHLDVGGKALHYSDHKGQKELLLGLAEMLLEIGTDEGGLNLPGSFDPEKLVDQLGLMDVTASGRSLVEDDDLWLLRQYSHYGKKPKGLVELMGDRGALYDWPATSFRYGHRLRDAD